MLDLQGGPDTAAPKRFSDVPKTVRGDRVQVEIPKQSVHTSALEQPNAMADTIAMSARAQYTRKPQRTGAVNRASSVSR